MIDTTIDNLKQALLAERARPLVITGAGISVASGVPTFRGSDPDAIWSKDVLEMGTYSYFLRHPDRSWAWYLDRFDKTRGCEPNAAHHALAAIESLVPTLTTVTQNVDGLHHKAGSVDLIEVHGASRKIRCTNLNCKNGGRRGFLEWDDKLLEEFVADPTRKTVPRCPLCNKFLRMHVLWFDESYDSHKDYDWDRVQTLAWQMTCLVLIGTSNAVGVTKFLLDHANHLNVPIFNIDPYHEVDFPRVQNIKEKAEEFLPHLLQQLKK